MAKKLMVLRLDPRKKAVARMVMERRPSTVQRMLRCREPRKEIIMEIEDISLAVVVKDQADTSTGEAGFRVKGGKTYYGVALLVGQDGATACDTPVDPAWVARMIEWVQ